MGSPAPTSPPSYRAITDLDAELLGVGGTDFTIASNGAFAIVAFRGTQPGKWNDIFADVRWISERWDAGHVHRGFPDALRDHTPLHYVIHVWNDFALHST
jgi:hypothetical protein